MLSQTWRLVLEVTVIITISYNYIHGSRGEIDKQYGTYAAPRVSPEYDPMDLGLLPHAVSDTVRPRGPGRCLLSHAEACMYPSVAPTLALRICTHLVFCPTNRPMTTIST